MIDLGFHAFDEFFKMTHQIGFLKEAARRGVAPVVLFVADTDRISARSYPTLQEYFPAKALITIDNEHGAKHHPPRTMSREGPARMVSPASIFRCRNGQKLHRI